MYNKISDFKESWKYESESTLKVLNQLTDDSLNNKFNDNVRTPGKIAWHIVKTLGEMVHRTGLKFDATPEDAPIPSTAKKSAMSIKDHPMECLKLSLLSGTMIVYKKTLNYMDKPGRREWFFLL